MISSQTKANTPSPYGDNPNVFVVLAHKTQQTFTETLEALQYGRPHPFHQSVEIIQTSLTEDRTIEFEAKALQQQIEDDVWIELNQSPALEQSTLSQISQNDEWIEVNLLGL